MPPAFAKAVLNSLPQHAHSSFCCHKSGRSLTVPKGWESGLGGGCQLPSQHSASTLHCPWPPPGACLIRSRPDLARGPGPGRKPPLPSLSCSRSGSQETPSLGVIYRGVQESFPSCFCSLPALWLAGLTLCPCLSPWPGYIHGGGREGLGDSFPDCLETKVLSSFSTTAPKQPFVHAVTLWPSP